MPPSRRSRRANNAPQAPAEAELRKGDIVEVSELLLLLLLLLLLYFHLKIIANWCELQIQLQCVHELL
jgi:hypothetical protein